VETGSVFGGSPAKKIKEISPELIESEINRIANNYHKYSGWYKEEEIREKK
jgi:carbonic anhydrase/acetyltransferase-like protein (isoleucine patch superfamily)